MCAIGPLSFDAHELRVRAEDARSEDAVADAELGHGVPDLRDFAGELGAEDPLLRPTDTGEEAAEERMRGAPGRVRPRHRRRAHPDEYLVLLRHRARHVLEPQDVRRPVPIVDDGPHLDPA